MAANSAVPVINALSDAHHPCQALADLLTVARDVRHARGLAARLRRRRQQRRPLADGGGRAGGHGGRRWPRRPTWLLTRRSSPGRRGRRRARWIGAGHRRSAARRSRARRRLHRRLGVDGRRGRGRAAPPDARSRTRSTDDADGGSAARTRCSCTACPPTAARRSTAEVIDGPQSVVLQQAANRLPTEQALLYALVTGDWTGTERDRCDRRRPRGQRARPARRADQRRGAAPQRRAARPRRWRRCSTAARARDHPRQRAAGRPARCSQTEAYTSVGAYPLDVLGAETRGHDRLPARAGADGDAPRTAGGDAADADDRRRRRSRPSRDPTKPIGPGVRPGDRAPARRRARLGDRAPNGGMAPGRARRREPLDRRDADDPAARRGRRHRDRGRRRRRPGRRRPTTAGCTASRRSSTRTWRRRARPSGRRRRLLLLTDVDGVYRDFGRPEAVAIDHLDAAEARALLAAGAAARGSMAPKLEAAAMFAESGGTTMIGSLDHVSDALAGRAGTTVSPVPAGVGA